LAITGKAFQSNKNIETTCYAMVIENSWSTGTLLKTISHTQTLISWKPLGFWELAKKIRVPHTHTPHLSNRPIKKLASIDFLRQKVHACDNMQTCHVHTIIIIYII